jgi:hypothetical protein
MQEALTVNSSIEIITLVLSFDAGANFPGL